eukprot:4528805-Prymnesium_polylepis.1
MQALLCSGHADGGSGSEVGRSPASAGGGARGVPSTTLPPRPPLPNLGPAVFLRRPCERGVKS